MNLFSEVPKEDGLRSGKYFHAKLESWARAEPLVIVAKFKYSVASALRYARGMDGKGANEEEIKKMGEWKGTSEEELSQHWKIEFDFVRATETRKPYYFDGVVHLAGVLYPDSHVDGDKEVSLYVVDQASRSFRGVINYPSALEAWHCLTTLGTAQYDAGPQVG